MFSMNTLFLIKLNSFEDRMNTSNNHISGLSHQINNLQSELYALNKRESTISNLNYDIQESKDYEAAKVKVDLSLNKLKTGSKLLFMYRNRELADPNWEVKEFQHQDGLNYSTVLDLSYEGNYETQLLIENDSEKQSENMSPINLKDELRQRLHLEAMPNTADSRGNLTFRVTVRNNFYKGEALKLESANCYIYYDDKLVHSVDIMKKGEKNDWRHEPIEEWDYVESVVLEPMSTTEDKDFMEPLKIKLIVKDKLGKEYEYEHENIN